MYGPWAEIHLGRLKANFLGLSELVGGAKVLAVVKADGYGHGIVPVARALAEAGVYGFAVVLLQEALVLREAGLEQPILHMGRLDPDTVDLYSRHNIRLSLHTLEDIELLAKRQAAGGPEVITHLKVDTGMGRLGVPYEDAVTALEAIKLHSGFPLEGIFTHFATADEADQSYLRYQLTRFSQFVHLVRKLGLDVEYFHAANSAAIVRESGSHFNMVRPGLLLYGATPSVNVQPPFEPLPVMDLMAPLVLKRDLKRGTPVGYGREYHAPKKTRTGVLQIGYADGLPIALSGKGFAGLNGKVYPLIGRMSMDMCNIGLEMDDPRDGTQAQLWGQADDPRLRVENQARLAGTNPYELLVRIGGRVERKYVED
ncbi:MAG: alanine racemase [Candidatus Neomarinimicrobiota bacterium]